MLLALFFTEKWLTHKKTPNFWITTRTMPPKNNKQMGQKLALRPRKESKEAMFLSTHRDFEIFFWSLNSLGQSWTVALNIQVKVRSCILLCEKCFQPIHGLKSFFFFGVCVFCVTLTLVLFCSLQFKMNVYLKLSLVWMSFAKQRVVWERQLCLW